MATLSQTITVKNSKYSAKVTVTWTYDIITTNETVTVKATKLSASPITYAGSPSSDIKKDLKAGITRELTNLRLSFTNTITQSINAGQSITIAVTFIPTERQRQLYTLSLVTQSQNGSSATVSISIPAKPSYPITCNSFFPFDATGRFTRTKWYGEVAVIERPPTNFIKEEYVPIGWATTPDNAKDGYVDIEFNTRYATNSALTLYGVQELDYSPPIIHSLSVERCLANGTLDDEGTYAKVSFSWEVRRTSKPRYYGGDTYPYADNHIEAGVVTVGGYTKTFTSTKGSDTTSVIIGNGQLNTDRQYDVTVRITDSQDIWPDNTTSETRVLATSEFPMDFNADATSMGIFMPAPDDKEGVFIKKMIHTVDKAGTFSDIFDLLRPVGSFYHTDDADFDPNISWGGSWSLVGEGKILLAGSKNGSYKVGTEYGNNSPTLTEEQLPSLSAQFRIRGYQTSAGSNGAAITAASGKFSLADGEDLSVVKSAVTTGHSKLLKWAIGGGKAHSVMQKSTAVYIWHRDS